ncbi:MAG: DUF4838 domain-containing protein [Planctomycetota bacterium]|jgi:hypothetical protein
METWDGGQMHGIIPSGLGSQADPYVYVISDGMNLTGTGVIEMNDKYVTFDFSSGTAGLHIAAGAYFDTTGSSRLSDPGRCAIMLGANNLTGAGDFRTVDVTKDSMHVTISGSGDVTVNSFFNRTNDAFAGMVDVDVGGSVNIGSIDTQDQSPGGNDGGDVTVRAADVTIGDIDTRALRTTAGDRVSGDVVLQARDHFGNNTLVNAVSLHGTINTDSLIGTDGSVTIGGVVVTLEAGFAAVTGDGALSINAGTVQYGVTPQDLFVDNSGGGYSSTHNVLWTAVGAACLSGDSLKELATLASRWLDDYCGFPDWCGGADIDQSENVDFVDYSLAFRPTEPLTLVDNGTCHVSIHSIVAGGPSTVELYAAQQLQEAFQVACGVTPQINPASPAEVEIRLGAANLFRVGIEHASEQAYTLRRTIDDHIELVGNSKQAVMWAVDDFCKQILHVSWPISTDVMVLQGGQLSTVTVEQICKVQAPDFPIRGWIIGANIDGYHYDDTIGKWMAHNRQNTLHNRIDYMHQGGGYDMMLSRGITVDTTMHTYAMLVPADEYYDEHPEYYPLIDGVRVRPPDPPINVQLCISNHDVCDIIIGKIVQGFAEYPDVDVFGVGQNDSRGGLGWCECVHCVALDGAQAGTGLYSNRMVEFINYLADAIAPNHPGKYVGAFAYGETRRPPEIDVADNVAVTFVHCGGNYMRKLTDPSDSANAAIMADLNGWLDKTDNVHFWAHYWTTSMDSCLTPYARTVVEAFSDLKALGLKGICCETRPPYWPSQRVFFYALARAGWDTSLDFDDILDDYCNEAYGPAALDMKSHYLLYENRIYEHVPLLIEDGACAQLFPAAFSSGDMDALEGYLAGAEAAAAAGSQANIDAVAEVREMFEKFKLLSVDPADIPGIGPNLVLNPGAESGSTNWAGDIRDGDYSFSVPVDSSLAHSGSRCLKIECTGAGGWARWYQLNIPVTPGKKCAARFWIRANDGAAGVIWVHSIGEVGWQDSGDQWARLILPEITATGSTVGIYLNIFGPGTVYFDDTFLAELPE